MPRRRRPRRRARRAVRLQILRQESDRLQRRVRAVPASCRPWCARSPTTPCPAATARPATSRSPPCSRRATTPRARTRRSSPSTSSTRSTPCRTPPTPTRSPRSGAHLQRPRRGASHSGSPGGGGRAPAGRPWLGAPSEPVAASSSAALAEQLDRMAWRPLARDRARHPCHADRSRRTGSLVAAARAAVTLCTALTFGRAGFEHVDRLAADGSSDCTGRGRRSRRVAACPDNGWPRWCAPEPTCGRRRSTRWSWPIGSVAIRLRGSYIALALHTPSLAPASLARLPGVAAESRRAP